MYGGVLTLNFINRCNAVVCNARVLTCPVGRYKKMQWGLGFVNHCGGRLEVMGGL